MLCAGNGAKDTASFEVGLSDDRLPPLSSITHEGIFYEHYFDVGSENDALFSCDWSFAASKDPLSGAMEYYVGCGMRGKLDGEGIRKHGRLPVQLSIVLDISGSMDVPFRPDETKTKLDVAKDCVMTLLDNLQPNDAFGLVVFDDEMDVVQEMQLVSVLDMAALKAEVTKLRPRWCTNMLRGFRGGVQLITQYNARTAEARARPAQRFKQFFSDLITTSKPRGHSTRIMFLTDACPNGGDEEHLLGAAQKCAEESQIYTTFIGLGVDFGVELVNSIAQIKGCNYFTVMSSPEFKKLMEQDFNYVVTPSCFDLDVAIVQDGTSAVQVQRVYGSPGHEIPKDGLLLHMASGFPSAIDENGCTKGGMILVKVAPSTSAPLAKQVLELMVTYSDVDGKKYQSKNSLEVEFGVDDERYSNNAIRKAILLTRHVHRFVNAMKWWITDHQQPDGEPGATVSESNGIPPAPVGDKDVGSPSLRVSEHYKAAFSRLLAHYERAAEQLADAGDVDNHLNERARQLVGLIDFISADEIQRVLATVTTDDEVAGVTSSSATLVSSPFVDADELQRRCEAALKVDDLTARRSAFETEIKRRLKNVIVARLAAREDKEALKQALTASATTTDGGDNDQTAAAVEAKQAEVVEELAGFIRARPDQDWSEWQGIVDDELYKLVHGEPRFRGFVWGC